MSITTSVLRFTHRFVGPCRAKDLQPYARPDILSIQMEAVDGTLESIPHVILRVGNTGDGTLCLELKSDYDEELYGFWTGTRAELATMLQPETRELRLWNLTLRMSARMMRCLLG